MCYDACAGCTLICGHAFCHSCVRQWYESSADPTCPMCRGSLYFRGMRRCVERWDAEAVDKQRADIWDEIITFVIEIGCGIPILRWAEDRFKYCDDVDIILDSDIEFEISNTKTHMVHDPFTWMSLLFVTKHRLRRNPYWRLVEK